MTLSNLAIFLGVGLSLPQVYALANPAAFRVAARKFPRYEPVGWGLMLLATFWFLSILKAEPVADFAAYKPFMYVGFVVLGVGTCIFLKDFLAVRGLALILLLLAKVVCDTARWAESPWRLVLVTVAYAWVVAGIWFTISPWRLRDLIEWMTANDQRIRVGSSLRLALGLLVAALGFTGTLR